MEKRKPDAIRWTLDKNDNPIQVKVWESSSYRHGSSWDYSFYTEDMDGNIVDRDNWGRLENEAKEEGKYSWETVYGFNSPEEALADKKKKEENNIEELIKQVKAIKERNGAI